MKWFNKCKVLKIEIERSFFLTVHIQKVVVNENSIILGMTKYEYLLFDADGTLYDFEDAEKNAIKDTWEKYNIPLNDTTINCYRKHNHRCWKELEEGTMSYQVLPYKRFELAFGELGLDIDPKTFGDEFLENLGKSSLLFPGALDILNKLKSRGYRIFIITNGLSVAQKVRFNRAETNSIYEKIFCSENLGVNKPDKRFFDIVFEKIGLHQLSDTERQNKAIVIGDSLSSDIQGGINAGLNTVWYNPKKNQSNPNIQPTHTIHNLVELLEYFQ